MIKKYYIIVFFNIIFPCAVCYAPIDTPIAQGTNDAVAFLLSIISFVLLNIVACIIYFYNRSKKINYGDY